MSPLLGTAEDNIETESLNLCIYVHTMFKITNSGHDVYMW